MSGPRASADLRALRGPPEHPAGPAQFPDVPRLEPERGSSAVHRVRSRGVPCGSSPAPDRWFTPRPSLSAGGVMECEHRRTGVSPGFTPRPSLSGLCPRRSPRSFIRVAGVHAPAFVERAGTGPVSPIGPSSGVAGVHAPAFVERGRLLFRPRWKVECRRGSRPGLR